ncbi:hypothetical protein C8D88_10848 [Lentzea atacamensis]|uniref:Uncharacterized protein n=1 Tax=Lentzea atacamensis TaxID=531938 RepID=A0A316HWC9_9PSEU|nr:hypothetical protein C8D88_10848 [Lentzea atacamensis]
MGAVQLVEPRPTFLLELPPTGSSLHCRATKMGLPGSRCPGKVCPVSPQSEACGLPIGQRRSALHADRRTATRFTRQQGTASAERSSAVGVSRASVAARRSASLRRKGRPEHARRCRTPSTPAGERCLVERDVVRRGADLAGGRGRGRGRLVVPGPGRGDQPRKAIGEGLGHDIVRARRTAHRCTRRAQPVTRRGVEPAAGHPLAMALEHPWFTLISAIPAAHAVSASRDAVVGPGA